MKNNYGKIIPRGLPKFDPNEFYFGRIFSEAEGDQMRYAISYLENHSIPHIIWRSHYIILPHISLIQLPPNETGARFYHYYWSDLYGLPVELNKTVPMWKIDMERTDSISIERRI